MAQSGIPGPLGLNQLEALNPGHHPTKGRAIPGPTGLRFGPDDTTSSPNAGSGSASSKPKALIVIGAGQDGIKKGVRFNSDDYFDKSARNSFAAYTADHDVTLRHVSTAQEMKDLIESDTWDVVIYFGHGVENQMALDPHERGKPLTEAELAQALKKAQTKNVFLFGCKAGETGLARKLSKDVPGITVAATFGVLEASWKQGQDRKGGTFTNEFDFKSPLTEYNGGFAVKGGRKMDKRPRERGDQIKSTDDLNDDSVDQ
jgi:hypothetical protein